MWWALIEEIAARAEEMACCVRGYQACKDTWAAATGEVLVCSREPTKVKIKLYYNKTNEIKSELRYNLLNVTHINVCRDGELAVLSFLKFTNAG